MNSTFNPDFFGFYGKLPARGDFLRWGLPPDCIAGLDAWACAALVASRAIHGDKWTNIWLNAPVWRFRLAKEVCGRSPVIGMLMPSADKAGRHFPLFIVAGAAKEESLNGGASWLDAVESEGLSAIKAAMQPEKLVSLLRIVPVEDQPLPPLPGPSLWWTKGAPHREAGCFMTVSMPSPDILATMLADLPDLEEYY